MPRRHAIDLSQLRIAPQAFGQPVAGNSAAQMVHVMRADVRREPLRNPRQMEVRAAFERGRVKVPDRPIGPVRIFELVLHVEEPHADRRGQHGHGCLNHRDRVEAEREARRDHGGCAQQAAEKDARKKAPAAAQHIEREPVLHDEEECGRDEEQDERIAIEPVSKPRPPRRARVFANRQRRHVTDAAAIQVAGGGVVDRMRFAPVFVRGQRQERDQAADQVVGPSRPEEGVVAAIMLNHEQADDEAGRGQRQQEGDPVTVAQRDRHRCPQNGERHCRDGELEEPALRARSRENTETLGPFLRRDGTAVGDRIVMDEPGPFWLGKRRHPGITPPRSQRERRRPSGCELGLLRRRRRCCL